MPQTSREINISKFKTTNRYASTRKLSSISAEGGQINGRCELDSHADTSVAGRNCVPLSYTDRSCDVAPYTDTYTPIQDVSIIHAATGYTSAAGRNYILVFNEVLWMESLDHSLINPNQLRHFGTTVQDNPYSNEPMQLISPEEDFRACLLSQGTTIYIDTWKPTAQDLLDYPHIVLTSSEPWNPHSMEFPGIPYSEREEVEMLNVASTKTQRGLETNGQQGDYNFNSTDPYHDSMILDIGAICTRFNSMEDFRVVSRTKIVPTQPTTVGPLEEYDVQPPHTFLSKDRHSTVTPEDLSERWGISLAQAKLTLGATTRRLLRSAIMPLARRYRVDRMFQTKRLRTSISTDTMDARVESLHGERYCQIFGSKEFFVEAYPIVSKADCHEALDKFVRQYGVPDELRFDGSKEQGGRNTKFMKVVRKYNIHHHTTEQGRPNQNQVEGVIRELRKKWYRTIFRTNCPRRLWNYALPYLAKIMSMTASYAGQLQGRTAIEFVTGETPDISEYLDFGFWDRVWFKQDAGIGEVRLGRFLGISSTTGSLMSYWVLPDSGIPESRTTVQRVTVAESGTEANRERFKEFDTKIAERFKEDRLMPIGDKPDLNEWSDLLDDDPDFADEFHKTFNNPDVPEADDDYTPEAYDTYLNMEMAIDRGGEHPEWAKVTKRLRDNEGNPIGRAHDNPILDTRMYEVEYKDGHKAALAANIIAENLFAQVDDEGHRHVLFEAITDIRADGTEVKEEDAYVIASNGVKRRKETTKGWEVLIQWKDGSTTWNALKDVKDSYPVQLAEYAIGKGLENLPAFAWWVPFTIKRRTRILAKIKSKYWVRTHKFGIAIPKTVKEALEFDRANGNTMWWDAIVKEMKNVRPAFTPHEGDISELRGFQKINCHMIFDIKMGENFRCKARLVAGGHTTTAPASITYSSVVSRDSVRIALTIAALNDLQILACDIQNAYLTARCREKIYTIAGPEFGTEEGTTMIITMALYGLKSSGAAFRAKLAGVLHDMGYRPSRADPDVWLRPHTKPCGFKYYEMALCYVDDILVISHEPMRTMDSIKGTFQLKDDKAEEPETYLGAALAKAETDNGTTCWTMSSAPYIKAAIANVEEKLAKSNMSLPTRCQTPMRCDYHPAEDTSRELDADGVQYYQELIGVLRWAIEIGRVDILLEVSLLSSHLALPRVGHLEQVYHIFAYLKNASRRRLYFDPDHPQISEDRFHKFDWEDFYRDAEEVIPPDMPEPRGNPMTTHAFVDANHAADKVTRRSQTGILIFCNRSPVLWFSKRQNSVETSTFGSEFTALKQAVEMVQALRYKLRMFGVPVDGPTNMFCDNEAVYKNASIPDSVLNKKHHSISYHRCREAVAGGWIRIAKEDTLTNLADVFTKTMGKMKRESLLDRFMY